MTTYWHNLCPRCRNRALCIYLKRSKVLKTNEFCPALTAYLDNDTPSKEPLASDLIGEGYEGFANKDYKVVLNEAGENRQEERARRFEQIQDMPCSKFADAQMKAVAILLWHRFSPHTVMSLLRLGKSRFYELCNRD